MSVQGIVFIKSRQPEHTNLNPLNKEWTRNVVPRAAQSASLKLANNQWITGYNLEVGDDEEEILKTKSPENKYKLLKARQILEKKLNQSLNPDIDNKFLLEFRIPLCKRNNAEIRLNLANAKDELIYNAAIAGGIIAPSVESINDFQFMNCMYYFSNIEKDASSQKQIARLKNQMGGKLSVFEDNKIWLLSVAHALGLPSRSELGIGTLYNQLDAYKTNLDSLGTAKKVWEVFDRTPLELETAFIADTALSYGVVKYFDNVWKYNGIRLGFTKEEVIANLKTSQFAESYHKIKQEIYSKYQIVNE